MIPPPKSIRPRPAVKERGALWQKRGLFVFFLPPYIPHLNIAEILWRNFKYDTKTPSNELANVLVIGNSDKQYEVLLRPEQPLGNWKPRNVFNETK